MDDPRRDSRETTAHKYLTFTVGRDELGLPISLVRTIYINSQSITAVPGLPPHLRGLVNMRGTVVPVLDTRVRFGLPPAEHDDTCIIVCEAEDGEVGLIVDSVRDVVDIPPSDVSPPALTQARASRFIGGIGQTRQGALLLLDFEKLTAP